MQKLVVVVGIKISGVLKISGSKNASLPILAASLLSKKKIELINLPQVKDIKTMLTLLESLGSRVKKVGMKTIIDNINQKKTEANYNIVRLMRGSFLVLGPLLAKFGKAKVSSPGGCSIGVRPIDIHLNALTKLGVKIKIVDGYVIANAPQGLKGAKIRFPKISVGATET